MRGGSIQKKLSTSAFRLRQPCIECGYGLSKSQWRPFSISASRGRIGSERMISRQGDQMKKQRSQKSQLKNIKANQIPTDFGLLGQDELKLFPPFTTTLPLLFKQPAKFFKLIWRRGVQSTRGYVSLWYTFGDLRRRNPQTGQYLKREKFRMKERPYIARDLHERLNTAIPAGDTDTIHEIACRGLAEKIKTRVNIRQQSKMPQESWELVRYNGISLPKWCPWWIARVIPFKAVTVVSDYATLFPLHPKSYIRQVIVRIKSKQQYDKGDGHGIRQKDLTEYVVIQKMSLNHEDRDWMFWGTVQPKTIKDIDELIRPAGGSKDTRDLGFVEKMKTYMADKSGFPSVPT